MTTRLPCVKPVRSPSYARDRGPNFRPRASKRPRLDGQPLVYCLCVGRDRIAPVESNGSSVIWVPYLYVITGVGDCK